MKKFTYILLASLGLGLGACEKDLDQQPLDSVVDQTFWTTSNDAVMAINACYRILSDSDQRIFLSCATDDSYSWSNWPSDIQFVGNGGATTGTGVFSHFWSFLFRGITRANVVLGNIDRVPNMDSALKERIKAEARFFRAYCYQQLVGMYGDVPLITELQSLENFNVPRTPKAEIIAFAVKELTEISAILPTTYDAANSGRITKGAAMALKARTLLYNAQYTEAAAAAKEVMDLNVYSIDPNYVSLFDGTNKASKEIILADQHIQNLYPTAIATWVGGPTLGGWGQVVPLQSLVDTYEMTDGKTITESSLYDSAKPFENRDPRLKQTIVVPGSVVNGRTIDVTQANSIDRLGQNNSSYSGYYYRKYIPAVINGSWDSNSWNDIIVLRYAEVLLTYAEAKIEAGAIDQTVYDAINLVRKRTSVNMPAIPSGKSQAQLREIIRRERRVEFALEEHRFFDIRRWRIAELVMPGQALGILNNFNRERTDFGKNVLVETRQFRADRDYLWPLPQNEIDVNPNATQNPNW